MENLYLNKPQLRTLLLDAPIMVLLYGRRLGKSTEIIAHLSIKRIFEMPRACFMLMGRTYKQLLERTIPSTKTGWQKRGYLEGIHYVVGKRPPAAWPKPYYLPSSFEHTISWFNGTCFCLGSQDREGLVNSLTVFGLFADEAKFLLPTRFKEDALPTVSAPLHYFPNNPHNRFVVLCSSMPSLPEGQWLFDYEKLMNKDACDLVLSASAHLETLRNKLYSTTKESSKNYYLKEIADLQKEINIARKGLVYFDEASAFANLNILGMDYFHQQRDILKEMFVPEILNIRPNPGEKSFYANLRSGHWYTDYNYNFLDGYKSNIAGVLDSRMDNDCNTNLPLHCGIDFGAAINCMVTAQRIRSENVLKTIKNHWVLRPNILDDLCELWCEYYRHHKRKEVRLWYDGSGNVGQANSKITYAQQAKMVLVRHGWNVQLLTVGGNNPLHHRKYYMINKALVGKDSKFPALLFNAANCEELKESMTNAPAKMDSKGLIHKVKTSERSAKIPPQYATHLSDAWDYLFYGEYNQALSDLNISNYDIVIR